MVHMSLRQKIGQLIVTGFSGQELSDDLRRLVQDDGVGNVILFAHNVENSVQLRTLCTEIQQWMMDETGIPALISIDQEGGRVTRLPDDATNVPGAMAIAATGQPELAYIAGQLTAKELRELGIHFNLAPVLDINSNPQNPVINVRSYGDTAAIVEEYGLQMLRGLMNGGILAAVKHFPGHGDTSVDSHLGLPVVHKTLEELMEMELQPFIRAIEQGVECIMSSHILFPAIEPEKIPATMSKRILTNLLKEKLRFEGLIVTDCLEMNAIQEHYGTAQGALAALKAGAHLLCISHTPALVREAMNVIEQAVLSGELSMQIIDDALAKVLYYKEKYKPESMRVDLPSVGCEMHRRVAADIRQKSISLVRGKLQPIQQNDPSTVIIGCYAYRTTLASSEEQLRLSFPEAMGEAFSVPHLITDMNPTQGHVDEVIGQVASYKRVVAGLYNGVINTGQLQLVEQLCLAGHHVTVVSLGSPYELERIEGEICGVAAFEYTSLMFDSLIQVLSGAVEPSGKWRIKN